MQQAPMAEAPEKLTLDYLGAFGELGDEYTP